MDHSRVLSKGTTGSGVWFTNRLLHRKCMQEMLTQVAGVLMDTKEEMSET